MALYPSFHTSYAVKDMLQLNTPTLRLISLKPLSDKIQFGAPVKEDNFYTNFRVNHLLVKHTFKIHHGSPIPAEYEQLLSKSPDDVNISLLDIVNHAIFCAQLKPGMEHLVERIVKYRDLVLSADTEGKMNNLFKIPLTSKYSDIGGGWNHYSNFVNKINQIIEILRCERLQAGIGDRFRHIDMVNGFTICPSLGITPFKVADMVLAITPVSDFTFTNLKNPRAAIAEFIKPDIFIIQCPDDGIDDIEDQDWNLFDLYTHLLMERDSAKDVALESIIMGVYLSKYTQWVNDITIPTVAGKMQIHLHTLLMSVYQEDDIVFWNMDWSKHPKENFRLNLENLAWERESLLDTFKPVTERMTVKIPKVRELVTGWDLVKEGNYMQHCVGGNGYIRTLPYPLRHILHIGDGTPEECITAEIYKNPINGEHRIHQAYTVGNKSVDSEHPMYATLLRVLVELNLLVHCTQSGCNDPLMKSIDVSLEYMVPRIMRNNSYRACHGSFFN